MNNYKDIKTLLTPRVEAKASDRLKARIQAIEPKHKRHWWHFGFAASIAAAAIVCGFIFIPTVNAKVSVTKLLQDAIAMLGENFTIEMEARTTPNENFEYYDPALPPIPVKMSVCGKFWQIDKSAAGTVANARVACGNDSVTYMWIGSQIGYRSMHSGAMLESFCNLLNPRFLLESELAAQNTSTKIEERDGKILLTITDESPLVCQCTFDAATHQLLDYSILTKVKGKKVCVLQTRRITYGDAVVEMTLPAGLHWVDVDNIQGIFGEKTAEQAAHDILSAFEHWDAAVLSAAFTYYNFEQLRGEYGGAKLIRTGRAFKKRGYGDHQFVPYELILSNGVKKKYNLSLVPADSGAWVVDGGI